MRQMTSHFQSLFFTILLSGLLLAPLADRRPEATSSSPSQVEAVEAGWPTFDVANLIQGLQTFYQIKQQVDQAVEQYQMLRKNFAIVSELTGWDGLDSMFETVDGVVSQYQIWSRRTDVAAGAAQTIRDRFLPEDGKLGEVNIGKLGSGLSVENINFFNEEKRKSFKEQLLQAGKSLKDMKKTNERLQKVRQCADAAKGSLSATRCMINVGILQANELSTLKGEIVRQGMYTALRGNSDYLTRRHRSKIRERLEQKMLKKSDEFGQSEPEVIDLDWSVSSE